jgi:hypothetical protein
MKLLWYILFSSMEFISGFIFILVQFRFALVSNVSQMALISILLSFVSYSFTQSGLEGILFPIVHIIIFVIYLQMVMKISMVNSFIMAITGYIMFGLVQTCVVAVFFHLGWAHVGLLKPLTNVAYQIQILSCVLMLLLSYVTFYFKGGFSFIEARSRFSKKAFTGKNKFFIIYILLAFIIAALSNIVQINMPSPPYLLIAAVLLVTLFVLFYLTTRRDESNG